MRRSSSTLSLQWRRRRWNSRLPCVQTSIACAFAHLELARVWRSMKAGSNRGRQHRVRRPPCGGRSTHCDVVDFRPSLPPRCPSWSGRLGAGGCTDTRSAVVGWSLLCKENRHGNLHSAHDFHRSGSS
jgi:hypothetical protein